MKSFEVIGIDDGFDYIKVVAGSRSKSQFAYPSVYRTIPSNENIFNYRKGEKKFNIDDMRIEFEGERFFIGQNVFYEDVSGEESDKTFKDSRFKQVGEKAKVLAGILQLAAKSGDLEDVDVELLVHGLNISSIKQYREAKEQEYQGTFKVNVGGETYKIKIHESKCIPEGFAALASEMYDYDGEPENTPDDEFVGVVDIGGKSVDFFINRYDKPVTESIGFSNFGISQAFSELSSEIGAHRNRLEYEFLSGKDHVTYKNKKYNLKKLLKNKFEDLAKRISNDLYSQWGDKIDNLYKIKLCGGASKHLVDSISKNFDQSDVELFDDPLMCNAIGFYKLGRKIMND